MYRSSPNLLSTLLLLHLQRNNQQSVLSNLRKKSVLWHCHFHNLFLFPVSLHIAVPELLLTADSGSPISHHTHRKRPDCLPAPYIMPLHFSQARIHRPYSVPLCLQTRHTDSSAGLNISLPCLKSHRMHWKSGLLPAASSHCLPASHRIQFHLLSSESIFSPSDHKGNHPIENIPDTPVFSPTCL